MGRQADKKSSMTAAEKEVVILRARLARLESSSSGELDGIVVTFEDIERLLREDTGYWRLGRARDGNYWARWKWTQGPYAGHYCMGGHNNLRGAIDHAVGDYEAVCAGKQTPPYDKGFKK